MERSTLWAKMNSEFNNLRAILAQTHPTRAEIEIREICAVLAFLNREAQKWKGKNELPFYERGAMLEAVFADDVAGILEATDAYFRGDRKPIDPEMLRLCSCSPARPISRASQSAYAPEAATATRRLFQNRKSKQEQQWKNC